MCVRSVFAAAAVLGDCRLLWRSCRRHWDTVECGWGIRILCRASTPLVLLTVTYCVLPKGRGAISPRLCECMLYVLVGVAESQFFQYILPLFSTEQSPLLQIALASFLSFHQSGILCVYTQRSRMRAIC